MEVISTAPKLRFDFKKYFEVDIIRLKYSGTWIMEEGEKPTAFFIIYIIITNFFCVFFNLFQVMNLFVGTKSIKDIAANAYVILVGLMSLVKSFCIFKNRRALSKIMSSLNDDLFQSQNDEQDLIVKKTLNHFDKLKYLLLSMTWTAVFSSMVTPLFYKKNEANLPFAAWFPFDASKSPVYEIVYVCQCIGDYFVSAININIEVIVMAMMIFIGMQCDLVSHSMINSDKTGGYSRPLKEYVLYHKKIIEFSKDTESILSGIYFSQFFACCCTFCMTLFLITLVDRHTFEFFFLTTYQASMMCLLLVPCWFSSQVEMKSEKISTAAYCLPWVVECKLYKKDMIYLMHRSQKPIEFFALGVIHISVETFVQIVKTSFSYFTVLNTLNNK